MTEKKSVPTVFYPGQILLYDRGGPFGLNTITKLKRGADVSHVEIVVPSPTAFKLDWMKASVSPSTTTITAKPKGGVDYYELDTNGLRYVLDIQPILLPNWQLALAWFEKSARGQKYDVLGMASFFLARVQGWDNNRQFCSEIVARLLKNGKTALLNARKDCDAYAPDSFKDSPFVTFAWER